MLWKAYRPVLISWCLCGAKVQEKEGSLALFTASELGGEFFTMVRLNDSKEHPLGFLNFGVLCLSSPPQSLGTLGIGPILAEALRGRRLFRVRSCGQRKDSAQEFLFIFCVAQAVFRPSASSCSVSSPGMLCMCSHAFQEGSVVEMLLCWWDGEVGMGCWVTAPSLAGFRPGRLDTPSWALTIFPSVWEGGGQSSVVSSLCLLVGSALWEGWWSSQSTHFQRDVVSFACLAGTFSEHYRPGVRPPRLPQQEGILWSLLRGKAQKLVSYWQPWVGCLPTARVALVVFALGPGLPLVPLLTLGSRVSSGARRGHFQ